MKKNTFSGYKMAALTFFYLFLLMGCTNVLPIAMNSICIENSIDISQLSIIYAGAGITGGAVGMFVTPIALQKVGPRKCMIISFVLMSVNIFLYSVSAKLWQFCVAGGIGGCAVGIGTFAVAGAIVANWFIEKRNVMMGIVVAASGLGTATFQALDGNLIELIGYKWMYRLDLAIIVVFGVVICLMIRSTPQDIGQQPLGIAEDQTSIDLPGLTLSEALKTPALWLCFLATIIGVVAYASQNSYFASLLVGYEMETGKVSVFSAVIGLAGTALAALSGKIFNKLGMVGYSLYTGCTVAAGALIIYLLGPSIVNIPIVIVISTILIAVGVTRQSTDLQVATGDLFGYKNFNSIQAILVAGGNIAYVFISIVLTLILKFGHDLRFCFLIYALMAVLSAVLFIAAKCLSPMKKYHN